MGKNTFEKTNIVLIEPPHGRVWDIPFGTLPALSGYLRNHDYKVIQRDLNTEIFLQLLEPGNIQKILDLIDLKIKTEENRKGKKNKSVISRLKRFILKNASTLPLIKKIYFNIVSHKIRESDTDYSLLWNLRNSKRQLTMYLDEIPELKEKWKKEVLLKNHNYQLFILLNQIYRTILRAIENTTCLRGKNTDFFDQIKNDDFNFFYKLYEQFIESINWNEITVTGITATSRNKIAALTIARIIRNRFPHIRVVMGGLLYHDAHLFDENDRNDLITILKEYVHFIVIGEGESAFKGILNSIINNISPKGIHNILWLKNDKLIVNKPFRYENPEDLPEYDFDGLPVDYYPGLPIEVNRGCYWARCNFCRYYHNYHNKNKYKQDFYRSFPTERIIKQIKHLKKTYGKKYFEFICLDISPSKAKQLSEAIIKEGLQIQWNARVRLDKNFSTDLFYLMQKSGATMFMLYPETFSKKVAALHNKNYDIDHIKSLINYWKEHKKKLNPLVVKIMTGFPGETFQDFKETLSYVKNNNIPIQDIGLFNLSKGSGVYYNAEKFGVRIIKNYNSHTIFNHYNSEWKPQFKKERQRIETWLFNNRKKWKKLCYGWSEKYKVLHES